MIIGEYAPRLRLRRIIQKLNETYRSRCLIVILPRHQSGTKELHEKHAHAYQVSLKSECFQKKEGTKEREGKKPRVGHVTPSFLTDDEEEFQSNINFGKSRLIFEFYLDISPSHYGVT